MAQELVFTAKVDTNEAEKELNKIDKSVQDTDKATKGLSSSLDKMTGGAVSGFKSMVGGVRSGIAAMKSLRVAIAATGLGALVIAVGSLVTAFQRNQAAADKINRVFAQIGAVVDILLDNFADLGVKILDAFENPVQAVEDLWEAIKTNILNRIQGITDSFGALGRTIKSALSLDFDGVTKGAEDFGKAFVQASTGVTPEQWAEIGESIKETADEMNEARLAADSLEKRTQALRDANIAAITTESELRAAINAKRLAAEEEGISLERQIQLIEEADAIEQQLLDSRRSRLAEEISILKGKQELSLSNAEDDRELAQLQAQLIDQEAESAQRRIRLNRRLSGLRKQRENEEKQLNNELRKLRIENIEDERERLLQEQELALEAIREKYGQGTELEKELLIKQQNELRELEQAERERELEEEKLRLENEILREGEESERRFELQRTLAEKERQIQLENDELTAAQRERVQLDYLARLEKIKQAEIDINQKAADAERELVNESIEAGARLTNAAATLAGDSKGIAVASATIDTFIGANKAIAQGGIAGIAAAAGIIATGLANVRRITSTEIPGTSAGGGGGGGGASVGSASISPEALRGDVTEENERFAAFQAAEGQQEGAPVQAFVLEGEVTSSQATSKRIKQRARL